MTDLDYLGKAESKEGHEDANTLGQEPEVHCGDIVAHIPFVNGHKWKLNLAFYISTCPVPMLRGCVTTWFRPTKGLCAKLENIKTYKAQ
jgi:hypothetical protein